MSQFVLPLATQANDSDTLIITDCNRQTVALLDAWRSWPFLAAVLVGRPGAGKSLLGRYFAQKHHGMFIDDADIVEDRLLFHQWNIAQQEQRPIVFASRHAPPDWAITVPDLASRLAASQPITLPPPDDPMRRALLDKYLAQSGLTIAPHVAEYALARTDRSYHATREFTDALAALALQRLQPPGHNLVREVLGHMHSEVEG